MTPDVFISYSSKDIEIAHAVCRSLEQAGVGCWMAPRDIQGGMSWSDAIMQALDECRAVVLLLSSASNVSVQVHSEINEAVNLKKPLLPIRIEDIALSRHISYYLGHLHWISAHAGPLESYLPAVNLAVQALVTACEQVFTPPISVPEALPRHNLPRQVSRFIGREKERNEVQALLSTSPLVTLTGSGGIGKTRIAQQVAEDVLYRYQDGVWLVELAALTEQDLVPQYVVSALGLREEPGRPLLLTLTDYLKAKHLLLALDNCEHLIQSCAQMVEALLKACPRLTILATSREALNITGERLYRMPSMSLPDVQTPTADTLNQSEAACLFTERAQLVKPDFAVTDLNASTVAQICHRLDGIPLALELAAARARSLPVEEINLRLDDRFRLLTGGSRTALPRQQTLQALIDWSYDLLTDPEKTLLGRLSIFAGGWTLQAAEQVCSGEGVEAWETLDLLSSLADKSLALAEEKEGSVRYRMLETMRQYAGEKLTASGAADNVGSRHQDHYLTLVEEAEPKLTGPEQGRWLDRLETEHDNLRAALSWSLKSPLLSPPMRFCGALQRFWWMRGHLAEGRAWCAAALRAEGAASRTTAPAKTLYGAGALARMQGDYAAARTDYEECLAIFREIEDRRGIAKALIGLGSVARNQSDNARARTYFEEGLVLFREIENRQGIASSLHNLGSWAHNQDDYISARAYIEESLVIRRELGDRSGIAYSLNNLASVANDQGDYSAARTYYEESLSIRREIRDRRGIAISLAGLGQVAYYQSDYVAAQAYCEECLAIFREIGDRRGIASSLTGLGSVSRNQGRYAQAHVHFEESLATYQEIGNRQGIAKALIDLGSLAREQSDYAAAEGYYEESLAISREIADRRGVAVSLNNLGRVACNQGDYKAARFHYVESLIIKQEIGDRLGIANSLAGLALLASAEAGGAPGLMEPAGESESAAVVLLRAARLWGAAGALRERMGAPLSALHQAKQDREVTAARETVSEDSWIAAWTEGRQMSIEQAVAYALEEPS